MEPRIDVDATRPRDRGLVVVLTGAAFLIFFQAFMIAPILPRLAEVFDTSTGTVGLAIPAYLIPYGVTSLVWGPVTDRIGRRPVILGCLVAFAVVTAGTATATGPGGFVAWRVAAGVVASGVIPVSVALVADVVPYGQRGQALGWVFGGMAGGMAVGSTAGALLEPVVGWRGLFIVVGVAAAGAAGVVVRRVPHRARHGDPIGVREVFAIYGRLLVHGRARRTYAYIAINAIIQSGIYAWLGVYLHERFELGPIGIGLALLGYGVPGFLFGPAVGRAADRSGRARLVPVGIALGGVAALSLAAPVPLVVAAVVIAILSLGYDLTQPLLAGIVTDLPAPAGQAVALMAVILFTGFGLGSLVFQAVLATGFTTALAIFGVGALVAALIAVGLFADERPDRRTAGGA